jgi:hypothetical protein
MVSEDGMIGFKSFNGVHAYLSFLHYFHFSRIELQSCTLLGISQSFLHIRFSRSLLNLTPDRDTQHVRVDA